MKMADYSMDNEKWASRVELIEGHMSEHDCGDMAPVIKYNLDKGTTDVDNRKRYWLNITNLFATADVSPIRVGKVSNLPQAVLTAIDVVCTVYEEAFTALFATHPLFSELERKRGKAGYAQHESNEAYGLSKAKNLRTRLVGYYGNYVDKTADAIAWDGTVDKKGMVSLIIPETSEVEG